MENILEELAYPQPTWSPNINTSSAAIQLQAEGQTMGYRC